MVWPQKVAAMKRSDIAEEKTILLPQFSTAMPDTFRTNDWDVLLRCVLLGFFLIRLQGAS
jgi:hypothetical protein